MCPVPRDDSLRTIGSSLHTLVPAGRPSIVRVSACSRPCGGAGGDFYDLLPFDRDHLGVFIGDVAGHGPLIGPVAQATRDLMRLQARRFGVGDPAAMLLSLNGALCERLPPRTFVTAVFGILNRPSGALRFVRAGHCRPLLLADGVVTELAPEGIALGLDPGPIFRDNLATERVVFRRGERLLLYTDGIVEGRHPQNGPFGAERLAASFIAHSDHRGEEECLGGILRDWRLHLAGTLPTDDVTAILLHQAD
jgi:sigma-B regulation protein RsbU (phosphoserine phosphatase)